MTPDIRRFINLVENVNSPYFFHGTNLIAGALIVYDGRIKADNPIDDDDLGAVVCVTEREDIGRMFAIEFERFNSSFEVGVVFRLDRAKVEHDLRCVPYEAETASFNEYEYRIQGDLPLNKYVVGATLVGETNLLYDKKYRKTMYSNCRRVLSQNFADYEYFSKALDELIAFCG